MKFEHILFPVDFSQRIQLLNPAVEWMATHFGSQVTLIHVFEIPATWSGTVHVPLVNVRCFDAFSERAERSLNDYSIHLPQRQVQRVIEDGDAAGQITNWADEHNVDLIMMATHGYGRKREFLLGSVTAKVIHDANCAVWTDSLLHLREKGHPKSATVLCVVELGQETIPLLRFAGQLAVEFRARVHVIHAVRKAEARRRKWFDFDSSRDLADYARMEISKRQSVAGTDFPVIISEAATSEVVTTFAVEKHADLILIARGTANDKVGRLRTHAYHIIRDAPCPVLSYPLCHQDGICSSC